MESSAGLASRLSWLAVTTPAFTRTSERDVSCPASRSFVCRARQAATSAAVARRKSTTLLPTWLSEPELVRWPIDVGSTAIELAWTSFLAIGRWRGPYTVSIAWKHDRAGRCVRTCYCAREDFLSQS